MILKINKIKKLGLFDDYTPATGFKDFKKYNLIYGWNGSGKTTFSKLFDALETGTHTEYPDLEFEIQNESSKKFQHTQPFDQKVRVFNQDYIENNLKIREGKTKAITLVLGNASKEVLEETEKLELELARKNAELTKEKERLENKEKSKGKTFTEIAKTIYIAISGGAIRSYIKTSAETDFGILKSKNILADEVLESLSVTVKQLQKPLIDPLKEIEYEFVKDEEKVKLDKAVDDILKEAKSLVGQQVESIVIDRLRDNQDISNWVETGLTVQHDHSSQNCEFCGQKIPEVRLQELTKHFNEADKILKTNIDNLIVKVSVVKEAIKLAETTPDVARFYEDLAEEYTKATSIYSKEAEDLLIELEKVCFALKDKKTKTTEATTFELFIDTSKFTNNFVVVNTFIHAHNKKTADFDTSKKEATQKIKDHYLSTIYDDVKTLEKEIEDHKTKINILTNGDPADTKDIGILKLKQSIADNKAKISSTHKACSDITESLNTFLGRQELVFEPHKVKTRDANGQQIEVDDGYIIKRNDKVVTHLSEGEKTAIAFVYFITHLNDPAFNKSKDIVVIDDPISSLDSNSIFQAFSFLKNSVKDTHQVFILTHNYDFLRLVLNWLTHRAVKKDACFYMIKNKDVSDERVAFLDELDKDLQDFESEYNYLFNLIYKFQSDGTIASVYHMPYIARKVLDTFLMFRVPNNDNTYDKLELLKSLFDEAKITAIYKFTNDQSHITGKGFDPSLIPETQKVVKYLLEFIDATFPEHYKVLTTT
jgi:wobble nucleotide-excising tRNase